jgi:energy-coupling factor transport system ATP-binding protein
LLLIATLICGTWLLGGRKYMITSLVMLAEVLALFFISFEKKRPGAREVALVAVLCAMGVAGRSAFFMLPQFKPVAALVILCAAAYGPETGFIVGAGTMLASNLFFGQGPWTPWQMCAMGLVGYLTGIVCRKGTCRLTLCLWSGIAVTVVYGVMVNFSSAIIYQPEITWATVLPYLISGAPFDLIHAGGTAIFIWLLAEPVLEKLCRVRQKFGLQLS